VCICRIYMVLDSLIIEARPCHVKVHNKLLTGTTAPQSDRAGALCQDCNPPLHPPHHYPPATSERSILADGRCQRGARPNRPTLLWPSSPLAKLFMLVSMSGCLFPSTSSRSRSVCQYIVSASSYLLLALSIAKECLHVTTNVK